MTIGIVGGGIAGLTAASALRRDGHDVTVFERAASLRTGGGALILWSNALKTLEKLDLRKRLLEKPSAQVVERAEFRTPDGELLSGVPIGDIARRYEAESVVLARSDLLALLHEAAGAVRFGSDVRGLRDAGDDVIVRLEDGTEARFDAVLGADGVSSVVRDAVGARRPLRHVGQDLWVGTSPYLPPELVPGTVTATLGAGRRFWTALLGDGRTFWYAVLRNDEGVRDLDALARRYDGWHDPIPALIARTSPDDVVCTPMRDREPSPGWSSGRITLAGDAAHAMTPDLGQGACQAIESAVAFRDCLREASDVPAALVEYERRRFSRTADVARMSWLVANTCGTTSTAGRLLRDSAIRFGMRATFMTQLDWLFGGA